MKNLKPNPTKQKAIESKLKYQNQKNYYKKIYTMYLASKYTCDCV